MFVKRGCRIVYVFQRVRSLTLNVSPFALAMISTKQSFNTRTWQPSPPNRSVPSFRTRGFSAGEESAVPLTFCCYFVEAFIFPNNGGAPTVQTFRPGCRIL